MSSRPAKIRVGQAEGAQLAQVLLPELREVVEQIGSVCPDEAVNCASRSNFSKARVSPCVRMILTRGIQSVCSPCMRCPTTSKGLHVSPPSCASVHDAGRPRSSALIVVGVRARMAVASSIANGRLVRSSCQS
jgi:hypothetical protein